MITAAQLKVELKICAMVIISPYDIDSVINDIKNDSGLMELWERYKDKNKYVGEISWNDVIESLVSLCNQLKD